MIKRLILICCIVITFSISASAGNYTAYQGTFNSSALNYFQGIMMNNIGKDYVAFRGSQYLYYLYWGDEIEYNSTFTGSDLDYIMYNSQTGSFTRGTDNLSLNPNNTYVYSNCADNFAHLTEVKNIEETRVNSIIVASLLVFLFFVWCWKR